MKLLQSNKQKRQNTSQVRSQATAFPCSPNASGILIKLKDLLITTRNPCALTTKLLVARAATNVAFAIRRHTTCFWDLS